MLAAGATANSVPSFRALVAADIPSLSASKITSDTFDTARIPNLSTDKLTSGTLGVARGGTGNTTGTATYATTAASAATDVLYPLGVTSTSLTTLKRDESIEI